MSDVVNTKNEILILCIKLIHDFGYIRTFIKPYIYLKKIEIKTKVVEEMNIVLEPYCIFLAETSWLVSGCLDVR